MSFTEPIDDDDDEELDYSETADQVIARLREVTKNQKKSLRQLEKDAETGREAAKKLAFIEAKLPDEPQIRFFLDNYKGEYTSEAIRNAAAEFGFIQGDPTVMDEVSQVEGFMNASVGGTKAPAPGTDDAMMREINAVTATGPEASKKIEEIMERYGRLVTDE